MSATGLSFSYNLDDTDINNDNLYENNNELQIRYKLTYLLNDEIKIKFGSDFRNKKYKQNYYEFAGDINYISNFYDNLTAGFIETELNINAHFAARAGGRFEYSSLLERSNLAPRLSLAYKTGKKSQVSLAYGIFYQTPQNDYLRFNHNLKFEKALHYILNYQIMKNDRIFRIEAYYKDYSNLIKFDSINCPVPDSYNNLGDGYAKGIDIFWRDNSFEKYDYWISYSYIDTKRDYLNYIKSATPTFVSNHNLSIVYKHFIPKISTQIGFTYTFASGRTYYNPNNTDFLIDKTKSYNDLSFNASYLTNIWDKFTIVYVSVSNILGFENIFGYHYSANPKSDGTFNSFAIKPGSKRFLFLGIFISL